MLNGAADIALIDHIPFMRHDKLLRRINAPHRKDEKIMALRKCDRRAMELATASSKREFADFYQARFASLDKMALVSLTIIPIMIALVSPYLAGSKITPDELQSIVLIMTIASLGVMFFFSLNYAGQAIRLRTRYHEEWNTLFPRSTPYPPVSYLLNFPGVPKIDRH